jgi:hypothetical protein
MESDSTESNIDLVEEIQQEIYQYWEENYGLDGWENGVQVFYDEADLSNDILIIGDQPGIGKDGYNFEQKEYTDYKNGVLSPPSGHNYLNPTVDIEKGMKKILGKNFEKVIKNSVKTNFNFFRARNSEDWNKIPQKNEAEEFCLKKVLEIRDAMDPSVILFEGMTQAWEKGKDEWGFEPQYALRREQSNQRLLVVSEQSDPLGISIYHPSYPLSDLQAELTRDIIAREISFVTDMRLESPQSALKDVIQEGEADLKLEFE